jgi:hypothetical protein
MGERLCREVYSGLGILGTSVFKNQGNAHAALQHIANAQKLSNPTARAEQLKNAIKMGALLLESASWSFDENGNLVSKTVQNPARPTRELRAYHTPMSKSLRFISSKHGVTIFDEMDFLCPYCGNLVVNRGLLVVHWWQLVVQQGHPCVPL